MTETNTEARKQYYLISTNGGSVKRKLSYSMGHHRVGSVSVDTKDLCIRVVMPEAVEALSGLGGKQKLTQPVSLGVEFAQPCFICGERPDFVTDGQDIFPRETCKYPEGILLEFELNIPSGIMVVANDLREHFNVMGEYDIQTRMGCVKTSLAMAKIGCAHAYVGNSSPGLYQVDEDEFVVSSPDYHPTTDEPIEINGDLVASIDTRLWWYSIVDSGEYGRRGCEGHYDDATRVKVRPGVYRFTHFRHMLNWEKEGKPVIYTKIKWIRSPDPVLDYLAEYNKMNFTVGQIVADYLRTWPPISNKEDDVRRTVDHIFCVNGTGIEWHPNGFPKINPDIDGSVPALEIPKFDKKYSWYPLCKYSAIYRAALGEINLNPSFVDLARNVLECMIRHGSILPHNYKKDNNLPIAKKCLRALNKRYPTK